MKFELTSELTDEIIYAMENQSSSFVFDVVDCVILPESDVDSSDEQRFFKLPEWNSSSGFRLMERFVVSLKNPPMREELRNILKSGQGVFRNFKDVLKANPDIEGLWFSFKEHEMKQVILSWFNDIRELWGLERLGAEPEESSELVHDDFLFRLKSNDERLESIYEKELCKEFEDFYGADLGKILSNQWKNTSDLLKNEFCTVVICETISGDPAGFLHAYKGSADSTVLVISSLFIIPQFRGLGLGKELLEFLLSKLKNSKINTVAVSCVSVPDFFKDFLERVGFSKVGSVFLLREL